MKKAGFFWVSYADLMTSLFFVMLILYIISFAIVKSKQSELQAAADQLKEIESVQNAIENLDSRYYSFDEINKRYKLNIDVHFKPNSSKISDIPFSKRQELALAGKKLFYKIDSIVKVNESVDYLLIIEGNAARYNENYIRDPDKGYRLSYNRALALFNFWKDEGFDFGEIGNNQCEIIIAGSGYFSQSRDTITEQNNKRFIIQVTSKVGKYFNKNEKNK
ncbi:flagellar motor protein MotB [uncultured Dokdonia sp.]|uniref:flagellar motor protein MotB n=1 Tax=uncultured Dokdonia sp. TaxID=575653 RepID=UPI002637622C|nr:flagellar motor protein MotB [uncultured Dokdonia sp.]